jgi:hypothetical protein
MNTTKARKKVNDMYGSAKRGAKQIVDSKEAHQLGAKAKKTTKSAERGAKRVIGSREVKDAGNTLVRDTKEFASAVYSAARGKPSKGIRRSQNKPKKSQSS